MLEFNGKLIRSVTAQGIVYVDDTGVEQFIDFLQCYENFVERHLSPESWASHKELNHKTDEDWDEYVEWVKGTKAIGARDIGELFIDFYTEPRIRFQFATQDEWWLIRRSTRKAGWHTFDLT